MKTLYILRHAKSDWAADYSADHERPLNKRGVRAAKHIGRFLAMAGEVPSLILTSTAVRAKTTVELAAAAGGFEEVPVTTTRSFYESSPGRVLDEVRRTSDEHASVLIAGHEPTWSGLIEMLTGARVRMVTAGLARIDWDVERWSEIDGNGDLTFFMTPRLLKSLLSPSE